MITVISVVLRVGQGSASTLGGLGVTGCEAIYCSRALLSMLLFMVYMAPRKILMVIS